MLKFSIIIPCRSVNDFLRENIKKLQELEYDDFEVIIVLDERESLPTSDARFRVISSGKIGPGDKRNIGASESSGDVVVFLDDDAYPHPHWLKEANKIFMKQDIYALGGPAVTPENVSFMEKMAGSVLASFLASGNVCYRHKISKSRYIDDYPTVNLFVKKEAFQSVGGFCSEFWPGEDTKLCLDLVKKYKKRFLYDPSAIVYHHRRALYLPFLKQISRYGMHRGQFSKIFPENSRSIFYFVPSLFVLGIISAPFLIALFPQLSLLYLIGLWSYSLLLLLDALSTAIEEKSVRAFFYVISSVFLVHIVYGSSFIVGLIKRPELKLRNVDSVTGNYLGG